MTPDEEKEHYHHHHQKGLMIPAGILLGLGVGMLVGYAWPGLLIGLGCGFLTSALLKFAERPAGDAATSGIHHGFHWMAGIIGIFFIIFGISIIWAPVNFWPYIGAGFLILIGIWFLARSFGKV